MPIAVPAFSDTLWPNDFGNVIGLDWSEPAIERPGNLQIQTRNTSAVMSPKLSNLSLSKITLTRSFSTLPRMGLRKG